MKTQKKRSAKYVKVSHMAKQLLMQPMTISKEIDAGRLTVGKVAGRGYLVEIAEALRYKKALQKRLETALTVLKIKLGVIKKAKIAPMPNVTTIRETAKRWKVSYGWVFLLIKRGAVPVYKDADGKVWIKADAKRPKLQVGRPKQTAA